MLAAREVSLAARPTAEVVEALDQTATHWLDRGDPCRAGAERWLPRVTGYAGATISDALDALFEGLRAPALWGLIEEELGDRQALDTFVPRSHFPTRCRAFGPRLAVVTCAGNVPVASLPSIVHCLLLKSACLVRVSRSEPLLPSLFAQSLARTAPWMAGSLAAVWWPAAESAAGTGEREGTRDGAVEEVLFDRAEAWIGYGSERTVESLRRQLPGYIRFQAHGHRIGFGVVTREQLTPHSLERAAAAAARDITTFDQQGCVSPRVFFVEEGSTGVSREFARALAERLEALRVSLPPRPLQPDEAAEVHQQRARLEMRSLAGEPVMLLQSAAGTAWTVILDPAADLTSAGVGRTTVIRPLARTEELPALLAPYRRYLQAAGVSAPEERWPQLAAMLGEAGVTRLAPLGQTQEPDAGWHHDGRPRLADLVRWVDWEAAEQ
jgi:hypothetical protein